MAENRLTVADFQSIPKTRKIVSLTAYTAPVATALDPYCDLLLVGDSLAMVIYGMQSTQGADLEMMIRHGKAVVSHSKKAMVIVDLPHGTYESSAELAVKSSKQVIQETGACGVKLEGGVSMAPQIQAIISAGIPVLGHIGLLPQKFSQTSEFRITGKDSAEAIQLQEDADAVTKAGAFGIVLEGIIEPVARQISQKATIPLIGIGASAACQGQILVTDDLIGLYADFTPKFVKKYANVQKVIQQAAKAYKEDVISESFPSDSHCFWHTKK
ncbi:3-methyl-2-oxobutanoate hydroxymethyltransferase [Alphaproteobacteria bacterium]|jgi:3-methyl-2-oxobutanoate hydroxymethyltransferase|nr:3-methyl-2-oxobutanoate hydroxymethyltransferase [Alphaproteobacteria bacterium]MDA9816491.1 3-methyl-2-oxobutanoate hydroxymethyltransferase [Alphaproteobacteria bacterium]MDC0395353.1 3-methyl-2-oxobutanoate hydroxymethyltransferase [Alphaproteobacteria bacterium]MDC0461862.1 3-methyl-2-oxobutanoate hydroxymethyltransferase [Alphaproteobacteria bacterium]MDC3311176.1 3-methyl-2-oxobutanoate hydroxymethyltransferase [Alphaproteobacteria bacterium]